MWQEWFDELDDDEVLVMIAIARKKYNEKLKSEQVVFREVVTKETWKRKFKKLKTLVHHYPSIAKPEDYSIYISYNPRSLSKALYLFENRMANWRLEFLRSKKPDNFYFHLKKLDREFVSCLQKPEAKSRAWHFLIDVDDMQKIGQVHEQIKKLDIKIKEESNTRNGRHILVKPFNVSLWEAIESVELKKDGIFHIYHVSRR